MTKNLYRKRSKMGSSTLNYGVTKSPMSELTGNVSALQPELFHMEDSLISQRRKIKTQGGARPKNMISSGKFTL